MESRYEIWNDNDKTTISDVVEVAFAAQSNDTIKVKITNCAIDEDNDMCDVICTIDNVVNFKNRPATNTQWKNDYPTLSASQINLLSINFMIQRGYSITNSSDINGQKYTYYNSKYPGGPIIFGLEFFFVTADFTLQYYKSGTNEIANINGTNAMIYDIDGAAWSGYDVKSELFSGTEGFKPLSDSNIYYSKSSSNILSKDGGIGVNNRLNTNGIFKNTSAFVVGNKKAEFKIKYGGCSRGILFGFLSPYRFELPKPTIATNKKIVYEEEAYNTIYEQYVPNNYHGSLINFLGNSELYNSAVFSFPMSQYEHKAGEIKIENENGSDVTSYFNITWPESSTGNIEIKLKNEYLSSKEFYNHLYTITIPKAFNKNHGVNNPSIYSLIETGNTIFDTENYSVVSEAVELKYDIVTEASIDNGTISFNTNTDTVKMGENNTREVTFKPDERYELESVRINGENIDINSIDINSQGVYTYTFTNNNVVENIKQNIEITTKLVKGNINLTKVDKNDNTILLSGAIFKIEKLDNEGNIDSTFNVIERTTDDNGKVEFTELLIGKYRITEIKAPEGYELSGRPIEVEITKDIREQNIIASDRLKLILPETGGNRIIIFNLIGFIVIIISIVLGKLENKYNFK